MRPLPGRVQTGINRAVRLPVKWKVSGESALPSAVVGSLLPVPLFEEGILGCLELAPGSRGWDIADLCSVFWASTCSFCSYTAAPLILLHTGDHRFSDASTFVQVTELDHSITLSPYTTVSSWWPESL